MPCWCSPSGGSSSSSIRTTWPARCAPKSLSTDAIALIPIGGLAPAGGCTALAGAWTRSIGRRLLEHSVEALPQQHEGEFDDALARHLTVLVPPVSDAVACRLCGAGKDPRRVLDGDALHRFGARRAESNEIGDGDGALIGDLLADGRDLGVGRGIAVQEAPHERVLLDELEVARDAGAEQLLCRGALQAPQRAVPQLLGVELQDRDVKFALGAEMVIQDRRHDTGARGDVLHLRLGETAFRKHLHGRVEDAGPPLCRRYPLPCHTEL